MIRDQHQRRWPEGVPDPARGVCDDQRGHAQPREHAHRQPGDARRVPLIQMKAAALDEHRHAFEHARDQLALVPGSAGRGEAGDLRVRKADRIPHRIGEAAEPGAEDDRDPGLERAEPPPDGVGRLGRPPLRTSRAPHPLLGHSNVPASVAERKFASVPAIMARNPSRARSCLRSGTSAPIPPIWMPTELTFAKPHKAKVAIVNDTGSSDCLSGPRSE